MEKLVKKESLSLCALPIIPRALSFNSLSPLASLRHKEASMEGKRVTSLRSYYRNRSKITFHTGLTKSPIDLIRYGFLACARAVWYIVHTMYILNSQIISVVAFDWEIWV